MTYQGPCALTSTGRVACFNTFRDALQWMDFPPALDFASTYHDHCTAGNSGVDCWGRQPEFGPGRYTAIAMSDWSTCAIHHDGEAECFGEEGNLALAGGPYIQIGTYHSVCGLLGSGGVECSSPGTLEKPVLDGTYERMAHGYGDTICGLSEGALDCWPKDGDYYVQPPDGVLFSDLSLGVNVICGVQVNGELMCWEYETTYCEYGCPSGVISDVPPGTFTQVSATHDRAFAIDTDGCVVAWPDDWGWGDDHKFCPDEVEPA